MNTMNTLPVEIVAEDQRLDAQARSAQMDLAALRWHWTLDESNPDRVSFGAYAAAIGGKRHNTISRMVNGVLFD